MKLEINLDWLKGKRTYIMILVDAIDQLGVYEGWWADSPLRYIAEFVLTGASLRAGLPTAPKA